MAAIWSSALGVLASVLESVNQALEPVAGAWSWGLAIVALTLLVRIVLIPVGVIQARTINARRRIAPQVERLHARYDTTPGLRRRDPDRFLRNARAKREALAALHRRHGIRPVASVAVVLAQSPVLFALYRMLSSPELVPALAGAPFVLIERLSLSVVAGAGLGAVGLLAIVALTTYLAQRQVAVAGAPAAAGQPRPATMALVVSGAMTAVAATLPAGVLVYWATTGVWTLAQQAVLIR